MLGFLENDIVENSVLVKHGVLRGVGFFFVIEFGLLQEHNSIVLALKNLQHHVLLLAHPIVHEQTLALVVNHRPQRVEDWNQRDEDKSRGSDL